LTHNEAGSDKHPKNVASAAINPVASATTRRRIGERRALPRDRTAASRSRKITLDIPILMLYLAKWDGEIAPAGTRRAGVLFCGGAT
jgi:hypothetical protein